MVNFGPLAAEIRWRVLGTPARFNGLTALLNGTLEVNFASLNRGRHLYLAGRPSRYGWALAHILVLKVV